MILDIENTSAEAFISRIRDMSDGCGKKYFVHTFGCQQNEADSEKISGMAEAMGYLPADAVDDASLIILNTCAIREHAEEKALSMLGRFKAIKKNRPDTVIGVCGCMAAEPHRIGMLKNDFHYVSFTLEPNMLHRIPELVYEALINNHRSFIAGEDEGGIVEGMPILRGKPYSASVSIMYGCNNFCTYCIVPYVRGRERSRNSEDVINECRELVLRGTKEIMLLGQNVNSYRSDMDFPELLSKIAEIDRDFIIRFMTSHPKDTSDELIRVMKEYSPKIAPSFHLPLQSGSDIILKKMNRTYTRERYLDIVKKLRENIPAISLSTDVIVGFPSESDDDFADTMSVLENVRFDMVYSFFYSKRVGTVAAKMDGEVERSVMEKRMSRLLELQDRVSLERNLVYQDQVVRVLVDSVNINKESIVYTGRTDTNKLVHFEGDGVTVGEFAKVRIETAHAYDLLGRAEI